MAFQGPRILQYTNTAGTGPFALSDPAPNSFKRYRDYLSDGGATTVLILDQNSGEWQETLMTLTYGVPDTLTTLAVISSSAGGAAVTFKAGQKLAIQCFPSYAAQAIDRYKKAVNCCITTAVLTSSIVAGAVVDGVTLVAGYRVGLFGQSDATGGVYIVQASGGPQRAKDFSAGDRVSAASIVSLAGTANGGTVFVCTNVDGSDIVGTSVLTWTTAKGPKGDQGIQGVQGPVGSTWRNGTGVPSNSLGIDGDYYLDGANGNVYKRVSGAYVLQFSLRGPSGTGTIASQDANNVAITGGSITNMADPVNPLDVANKQYVDSVITGLLDLKGSTDCSANPNYPAASKGDTYVVIEPGKIGGASGKVVATGDLYLATANNAGGTEASVGSSWTVVAHSLVGACLVGNNLNDLTDASAARINLGLGDSAVVDIGTIGPVIPLCNGVNTWGDLNTFSATLTISAAVDVTSYDGLVLESTEDATSIASAYSPREHFHGSGWKTAATAGPQDVDVFVELRPQQGTANPTAKLVWSFGVNLGGGGTESDLMWLDHIGTAARVTLAGNGTYATGGTMTLQAVSVVAIGVGNNQYAVISGGSGQWRVNPDLGFLQMGGTSSSFPMIKRSGTVATFRLADDSGDCDITAAGADFSGDVTIDSAATLTIGSVELSSTTIAGLTDPTNGDEAATKNYVDGKVTGLMSLKGNADCSANPNYPAAVKGDAYVVTVAGKIGGGSGKSVDTSDVILALADNAGGNEATVGSSWTVLEHNLAGALLAANNLSDLANAGTARTNLGLGSLSTLSSVAATLLVGGTLAAGVGFAATDHNENTKSSGTFTPDPTVGNFQYYTNGGAHTLAPPSASCSICIEITNNGSAGAITTSGFSKVTGDAFDTTNGHAWQCYITKTHSKSTLNVQACQ